MAYRLRDMGIQGDSAIGVVGERIVKVKDEARGLPLGSSAVPGEHSTHSTHTLQPHSGKTRFTPPQVLLHS